MSNLSLRIINAIFLIPFVIFLINGNLLILKIALNIVAFLISKEIHDIIFNKNHNYLLYLSLLIFYPIIAFNQEKSWILVFVCLFIMH